MSGVGREGLLRRHLQRVTKRDVSGVGLDDDLGDVLGIDSLSMLELLALVEEECDVTLDENDLSRFRTLRLILEALDRELSLIGAGARE